MQLKLKSHDRSFLYEYMYLKLGLRNTIVSEKGIFSTDLHAAYYGGK